MGKESILFSCDNSGIVYSQCISLPTDSNSKEFKLACVVRIIAKSIKKNKPGIEKKKKYLGLVVCLKKISRRQQGIWLRSSKNKILCLNSSYKFLGTNIKSSLCRDIRYKKNKLKFKRIISYSNRYF